MAILAMPPDGRDARAWSFYISEPDSPSWTSQGNTPDRISALAVYRALTALLSLSITRGIRLHIIAP